MGKKKYLYNTEKNAYVEITEENKESVKTKYKANPSLYKIYEIDEEAGGGASVNFTEGSQEPQEQSLGTTTTSSSQGQSEPSEKGGKGLTKEQIEGREAMESFDPVIDKANYTISTKAGKQALTRQEMEEKLFDDDFLTSVRAGEINLKIKDDEDLQKKAVNLIDVSPEAVQSGKLAPNDLIKNYNIRSERLQDRYQDVTGRIQQLTLVAQERGLQLKQAQEQGDPMVQQEAERLSNEFTTTAERLFNEQNEVVYEINNLKTVTEENINLLGEAKKRNVELVSEQVPFGVKAANMLIGAFENFVLAAGSSFLALNGANLMSDEEIEEKIEGEQDDVIVRWKLKQMYLDIREGGLQHKKDLLSFALEKSEQSRNRLEMSGVTTRWADVSDPLSLLTFATNSFMETVVQMPTAMYTFGGSSYIMTSGLMYADIMEQKVNNYVEQGLDEAEAIEKALLDDDVNKAALNSAAVIVAGLDLAGSRAVLGSAPMNKARDIIKEHGKRSVLQRRLTGGAKGLATEQITEISQEAIEEGGKAAATGGNFIEGASEFFLDEDGNFDATATKEIFFKTLFGAGGMSIISQASKPNISELQEYVQNPEYKKVVLEQLDAMQSNGDITESQADNIRNELQENVEAITKIELVPDENKEEALGLQKELDSVTEQLKSVSPALRPVVENRKSELEAKILDLAGYEMIEGEVKKKKQTKKDESKKDVVLEDTQESGDKNQRGQEGEQLRTEEAVQEEVEVLSDKVKFNDVSQRASKKEPINENEISSAIDEAYTALEELEGKTSDDANLMRELIEDEIENLESYDNITTTETRKIAEERTRRVPKKASRKTVPRREKDFVGKKAKYRDNKGSGGSGTITVAETPDGKEYYVLESAPPKEVVGARTKEGKVVRKVAPIDDLQQKVVLGETSKVFKEGEVNLDQDGNPVSVTFPMSEGKQITVEDPSIAKEVQDEQTIQMDIPEEVFEEAYIEFVGEEQVEVKKPTQARPETKKTAEQPKAKKEEVISEQKKSGAKQDQSKKKTAQTVSAEEEVRAALAEKIKDLKGVAKAENDLKKAWQDWKSSLKDTSAGIIFNPKSKVKEDVALTKALVNYVSEKIKEGAYNVTKFANDLKETFGVEFDNIKDVFADIRVRANEVLLKTKIKDLKERIKEEKAKKQPKTLEAFVKKELKEMGIKNLPVPMVKRLLTSLRTINDNNYADKVDKVMNDLVKLAELATQRTKLDNQRKLTKRATSTNNFGILSSTIKSFATLDREGINDLDTYDKLVAELLEGGNPVSMMESMDEIFNEYETQPKELKTDDREELMEKARGNFKKPNSFLTKEDAKVFKTLQLITPKLLEGMSNSQLKMVARVKKAINSLEGEKVVLPQSAYSLAVAVEGEINANGMVAEMEKNTTWKTVIEKILRPKSMQLANMAQAFGLKDKGEKFRSFFDGMNKANDAFVRENQTVSNYVLKLLNRGVLPKTRAQKRKASVKAAMYMTQLQHEANNGAIGAHSLDDLYEATLGDNVKERKAVKKDGQEIVDLTKELYKKYKGKSAEEIFKDLNKYEKSLVAGLQKILADNAPKVQQTASSQRIKAPLMYKEYFPFVVAPEQDITTLAEQEQQRLLNAKSGHIEERQKNPSAISFDAVGAVLSTTRSVLRDYHFGERLRVEQATFRSMERKVADNEFAAWQADKMREIVTKHRRYMLEAHIDETSRITKYIQSYAYFHLLGTVKKLLTEGVSNFVGIATRDITQGRIKGATLNFFLNINPLRRDKIKNAVINTGSTEGTRLTKGTGVEKYGEVVGAQETLNFDLDLTERSMSARIIPILQFISTPSRKMGDMSIEWSDKASSLAMWESEFKKGFKKQSGKKPNMDKIANNDKSYMEENEAAIEAGRLMGDQSVQDWFNTTNIANKPLKQLEAKRKNNVFSFLNYFMLSFMIQEQQNIVKGAVKEGALGVAKRLPSAFVRLIAYNIVAEPLLLSMTKLVQDMVGEDDEDDKITWDLIMKVLMDSERLKRAAVGGALELTLLGYAGGVGRLFLYPFIEILNMQFGEALGLRREGQDYMGTSIVFNRLPLNAMYNSQRAFFQGASTIAPPLTPFVDVSTRALELYNIALDEDGKFNLDEAFENLEEAEKEKAVLTWFLLSAGTTAGAIPRDATMIKKTMENAGRIKEEYEDDFFKTNVRY